MEISDDDDSDEGKDSDSSEMKMTFFLDFYRLCVEIYCRSLFFVDI